MRPATQLIEQGIKAYTRGALDEAERCWREALALEPMNDRARAYLDLLTGARAAAAPAPAQAAPVPAQAAPAPVQATPAPIQATPVPSQPAAEPEPEPPAREPPVRELPVREPPAEEPLAEPPAPQGRPITLSEYAPSPWDQGPEESASIVLDAADGVDLSTIDEKSDLRSLVPDGGQPPDSNGGGAPAKPASDVDVWMQGARELHALGDFSGSLEMIEKILKIDPSHAEARAYLKQNEATLIAMYESKLGSMSSIPRLVIKPEEVLWLNLDHRAGFLLAQIDGAVNYEDLFALSGLPRLDTARILATLLHEGVINS